MADEQQQQPTVSATPVAAGDTASADMAKAHEAKREDAERTLQYQIGVVMADPNIPQDLKDTIIANLLSLRHASTGDILRAVRDAEIAVSAAHTQAVLEASGQAGESHFSASERGRLQAMNASFDVHSDKQVHAFLGAMIGDDAEPGTVDDAAYLIKHDPAALRDLEQFNALDAKTKQTVTAHMVDAEHDVKALTSPEASRKSPEDAEVAQSLALTKATKNYANPEVQQNLRDLKDGKISRQEFIQKQHESDQHVLAKAAADEANGVVQRMPKSDQKIVHDNGGLPNTLTAAAQAQQKKDKGEHITPKETKAIEFSKVYGAWLDIHDLNSAGQAFHLTVAFGGQETELPKVRGSEMVAAADAVYKADVGKLDSGNQHITPEQRLDAAMKALKADQHGHYSHIDEGALRVAAQTALQFAQAERDRIRNEQTNAIVKRMADEDARMPDEWDKNAGHRRQHVLDALTASKLPTDHLSSAQMKEAVDKALQQAQERRNAESVREQEAVLKKAIAVDYVLADEAPDSDRNHRVARIKAALVQEGVKTDYIHAADLEKTIAEGLDQAQKKRDVAREHEKRAVLDKAIAVDYALADEAPGSDRVSRIARIKAALVHDGVATGYLHKADLDNAINDGLREAQERRNAESLREQESVKRTAMRVSMQFADIEHTDKAVADARIRAALASEKVDMTYIHHSDLDKTIKTGIAEVKVKQADEANANRSHNAHLADLQRSADQFHAGAKGAGQALTATLAGIHVDMGKGNSWQVDGGVAKVAGNMWESAVNFAGDVTAMRANLNLFHAPVHFTAKEVHDDVRDILKDPKQLAALMKDMKLNGVDPERLHLSGDPERDIVAINALLKNAHVDLISFNDNKNGHKQNAKIDEKELADALSAALKAGATVPVHVASGAHTAAPVTTAGQHGPHHGGKQV